MGDQLAGDGCPDKHTVVTTSKSEPISPYIVAVEDKEEANEVQYARYRDKPRYEPNGCALCLPSGNLRRAGSLQAHHSLEESASAQSELVPSMRKAGQLTPDVKPYTADQTTRPARSVAAVQQNPITADAIRAVIKKL